MYLLIRSYPCPVPVTESVPNPNTEPVPLCPHFQSQITHQFHFIPLAQTANQSDSRMGRNMIEDWLVGGEGVEQLSHPLTTAACCEMSERAWETERIHSSSAGVFHFSAILTCRSFSASTTSSTLPSSVSEMVLSTSSPHTHTNTHIPSAVSLNMTADSVAYSYTE